MKIVPVISEPIYLRDISKQFKELEGDVPREEQVNVVIRQATQADVRKVSRLVSTRKVTYSNDGTRTEVFDDDMGEVRAMQLYTTLCDVGGLTDATDAPLFRFKQEGDYPKLAMGFADFQEIYGTLPSTVVGALNLSVWEGNPQWDMRRIAEGED